ncbi:MAG TPA: phenylalanine--tRNA ligase subunit alpha, partial [Flavobacteriales bacterium]|nr:phenylalanine--tRNA ligase subunit alpha [Flavobacteriales bacterium]
MIDQVERLLSEVDAFESGDPDEIEQFRIRMIGKKGKVTQLFALFKEVPNEQKKEFGKKLNELKTKSTQKVADLKGASKPAAETKSNLDISRPAEDLTLGSRHPISIVRNEIIDIFSRIGFSVSDG